MTLWTEILNEFKLVGVAMIIFIVAYMSNFCFSLYYNLKVLKENFDWKKILNSILKIIVFIVGLGLLVSAIVALPIFANEVGWTIPEEYLEVFSDLLIIGIVLTVSCRYIKEAFEKFKAILQAEDQPELESESEIEEEVEA